MPFRFCSLILFFALLAPAGAAPARDALAAVGITHLTVPGKTALRGDPANRLNVVVWYPASPGTPMQPIAVGAPDAPLFLEGEAATDAPLMIAAAAYPLIVVSHGTGGTSMDLSWLCAGLAARGFIVASVDHPGNNALEPPTIAGTTLWWMRADDLSHVIDGVLASARFGPHIDPARIGAAGFSIGGYTVLVLGGARGNPDALDAYCAQNPATEVCTGASTPSIPGINTQAKELAAHDAIYRAAMAANTESHRDARVKAIFSIAPALGPVFIKASLAAIDVPVAFVAGIGDPVLPVLDNVIPDALAIPDARVTLFSKAVGHYTFLTDCTPAGRARFAPICGDAGPARVAIHDQTRDLAVAFFRRTLAARLK